MRKIETRHYFFFPLLLRFHNFRVSNDGFPIVNIIIFAAIKIPDIHYFPEVSLQIT